MKPEIKEKIITAANELVAQGIVSPTNEQVREHMGGGSLSHISPAMRKWRESRKAEVVAALEMPADLKRVIDTSLSQVWTAASKLASTAADAVREEAAAAVKAADSERDEALKEVARLEELTAELQGSLDGKDQAIAQAIEDLEGQRAQVAKLASENAALSVRLEERETQINTLQSDLNNARVDNKELQGELLKIARKNTKPD